MKWNNGLYLTVAFAAGDQVVAVDFASDGKPDYDMVDLIDEDFEVTDVDSNVKDIGEYIYLQCSAYEEVQEIADQLRLIDADIDLVNACIDAFGVEDALEYEMDNVLYEDRDMVEDVIEVFGAKTGLRKLVDGDLEYLPGITDDEDLGRWEVENYGFPSVDSVIQFLDLEQYGDDLRQDFDDDEAERIEREYGDFASYAQQVVEDGGLGNDYDPYFDYEMYGHDAYSDYSGGYGANGFVYDK